jgi:hypothetical protein
MKDKEICKLCVEALGENEVSICNRCKGDNYPNDTRLRKHGFAIYERGTGKSALWRRIKDGKIITLKQALKECG